MRPLLLSWFDRHARALPWRLTRPDGRRDPYRVWISEVLLQQTQVARGLVYFERFLTAFPDVERLAAAPEEAVLKAWEGCGYYARARNLHRAAREMAASGMPTTHQGWLALPGVGPYTAAAVASLAFGERQAVMDGNVRRVLSRLSGVREPTDRWAQQQADVLLDPQRPGDWNEALMDLGATICTPKSPRCAVCPLQTHCAAFASGDPAQYPAPKKRAAVQVTVAVALLIGDGEQAYLEQRTGTLLGGLWGLPLEEVRDVDVAGALNRLQQRLNATEAEWLGVVNHTMTHRQIQLRVYRAQAAKPLTAVGGRPLSRLDHKALALLAAPQPALFAG